jgi:hypothetical protein
MSVRGYTAAFDWSRSGGYGGTLEDVSSYIAEDDMVLTVGRDTTQAASNLASATLEMSIVEKDALGSFKFAPELSTSPIFGKVVPGVPFTLQLEIPAVSSTTLYTGVLDDFEYSAKGVLSATVTDAWGAPSQQKLSTTVYQGMRTGDLIGVVLDAIGWTGGRDIDPGATVVNFWWSEGDDAATAIQKLVDSEGPPAIAYVEAGVFMFRDRHHRITDATSLTSQATFTHIYPPLSGPAADYKILRDPAATYKHGRTSIINTATFQVGILGPDQPVAVWTQDTAISIPAGTTAVLTVTSSTAFINAVVPVQTTAFDPDTGAPNGDMTVDFGSVSSVTLSRTSGQSLTLTIVAGGSDTVISFLQIRANPLTVQRTYQVTSQDAGSVASKGALTWPGSLPWCNQYDAQSIADRIVATYATARPIITFTIDGALTNSAGTSYLTQFAGRTISDRITIRHDLIGINGDYFIEKTVRTIRSLGLNGSLLAITAEAIPATGATNPFTFDVAGKGFNDGQFQATGLDNPSNVFRFDVASHGFNDGAWAS